MLFLDLKTPKNTLNAGIRAIDWLGSLLIVTGTVILSLGLRLGFISFPLGSTTTICLLVFSAVSTDLFVLIETKFAASQLRLSLSLPFDPLSQYHLQISALGFVFISGAYFLLFCFQAVLGATPLLSGVYVLRFVMTLSLMATISVYLQSVLGLAL